eukprot:1142693-Pelagomonas_calceolata.AAC.1
MQEQPLARSASHAEWICVVHTYTHACVCVPAVSGGTAAGKGTAATQGRPRAGRRSRSSSTNTNAQLPELPRCLCQARRERRWRRRVMWLRKKMR